MDMKIERGSAKDVAHDPGAAGARYGRSVQTICKHWPETCGFPMPDFYAGRTPFWYLTTLLEWEKSRTVSPYRKPRADKLAGAAPSRNDVA
jgi:hypothetical protein